MNDFWLGVCLSIVTGAVVNELSDLSPWLAVRVARLAARLWGWSCDDPEWAAEYREAWPNDIQDRPGKLFKLAAALWLLGVAAGALPARGVRRIRLSRHRHPRPQRPHPVADPRLEQLWGEFTRAYKLLFIQSMLTGILGGLSKGLFTAMRPYILIFTLTGVLMAAKVAHHATRELIQALRNPPGSQPPLPTSAAIRMIMDLIVEILRRARERLNRWMHLLRFAASTLASYS